MYKQLSKAELNKNYKKIQYCIYTDGKTAFKDCFCSLNPQFNVQENIRYIHDIPVINGYTRPINVLCNNGEIYGYEMEYLKGYIQLDEWIKTKENIPFEKLRPFILSMWLTLRKINRFYSYGDINSSNIMINKEGKLILIDWENGTYNNSFVMPFTKYEISGTKNSFQSDVIKLYINTLSVIYHFDFEKLFTHFDVNSFYYLLKEYKINDNILKFLEDFLFEINTGTNNYFYLDKYLTRTKSISLSRQNKVSKNLYSDYYPFIK